MKIDGGAGPTFAQLPNRWAPVFFKVNQVLATQMGVSENSGTPKSSILIGFSIINHPFWDNPIFGNTQIFSIFYSTFPWIQDDPI